MDAARDIGILKYLLDQVLAVIDYTEGYNEDKFLRDNKTKDAVLTRLMVIGEYGDKVSDSVKIRFAEVDWRTMKLARNYYAHVYRGIDWILVWHVITAEIPSLKINIENIIDILEKENNAETN